MTRASETAQAPLTAGGYDVGARASQIGRDLAPDDLDELLALAEFTVGSARGMLTFHMAHRTGWHARMHALGLTAHARDVGMPHGSRRVHLTKLGWLALLFRCRQEMAHVLPPEPEWEGTE